MNHHAISPVGGKRVFLAYSHDDSAFAKHIGDLLAEQGHQSFDGQSSLAVGADWSDTVLNALKDADAVVFIVPAREGSGKGALEELGAAKAMGKKIVAVMPDSSRAWNTDVARAVTRAPVLDASRMNESRLVEALAFGH